jgi:hypothetical protein
MLFNWENGLQGLLNTTLFSNTPGGAVVAGRGDPYPRRAVLRAGEFYPRRQPGRAGAALGGAAQPLRPAVLSGRTFCLVRGAGLTDSPIRPLARVLENLSVMDEVRRQIGVIFNEER